jgi:hypothetical protein
MEFDSARYDIRARASAGVVVDADTAVGSSASAFGLRLVNASAHVDDMGIVSASASASVVANWLYSREVGRQSLYAATTGVADTSENGLSASASASTELDVRFIVTYDTTGTVHFRSVSAFGVKSELERFNGATWEMIANSGVSEWAGTLRAGEYRWRLDEAIDGSGNWGESYLHDVEVMVNDPVPEPASLAVLGLGLLVLARKR